MTTAIVTLSCPHCGGRTEGVRSIEAPQTVPCPYCRTELHVPRVGERVIERERIIERTISVEPPKPDAISGLVAFLFVLVAVLVMATMKCSSGPPPKPQGPTRAACIQQCTFDCPPAPETVSQLLARDADYSSAAFDRAFTRDRCVNTCEVGCSHR